MIKETRGRQCVLSLISIALLVTIFMLPLPKALGAPNEGMYDVEIAKAVRWLESNQKASGSFGDNMQILETSEVLTLVSPNAFSNLNVVSRASDWLSTQVPDNHDDLFRMLGVATIKTERDTSEILGAQNLDGGWGISGSYQSDVFDTLLALDALMNISLTEISPASNGVSYLLKSQNPDGGWSYAQDSKSSVYLTAHTIIILQNYKNARHQSSETIEVSLLNGQQFLLSSINSDGTWGLTESTIKGTLFSCAALKYTNSNTFDAVLKEVIGIQQPDGSLFASPSLTARLIWLLYMPDSPKQIVTGMTINAVDGTSITAYTDVCFVPKLENFNEESMELILYLQYSSTEIIPIRFDEGYIWNTEDTMPGEYSLYSSVFDKKAGRFVEFKKWTFEILPGVGVGEVFVFTNPVYTRVTSQSDVKVSFSFNNLSNSDGEIIVKTIVSLDDGTSIATTEKKHFITADQKTSFIEALTFTPDVSAARKYLIRINVFHGDDAIASGDGEFWVVPLTTSETVLNIEMTTNEIYTQDISLAIPIFPPKADILFSFDLTASMGGILNTAKNRVQSIMTELNKLGMDINYGVVSHRDYSDGYPYRMDCALTNDIQKVSQTINTFYIAGGGDGPESYTRVLYESYSDDTIGWREGSRRILIMFGDDVPHDNNLNEGVPGVSGTWSTGVDSGRDGRTGTADDLDLQTVLKDMASNNIILLSCQTNGAYANYWSYWAGLTGGKTYNTNSTNLANEVINAISESLSTLIVENLTLVASDGFSKWIVDINPVSYTGETGLIIPFIVRLKVPSGTLDGKYSYILEAIDSFNVHFGSFEFNITVRLNPYQILGEISLDKHSYNALEDVQVGVTARSFIDPPKPLTGTVEIIDAGGMRIALLDEEIEFDDEFSKSYIWNTGDLLSGTYAARLWVYDGAMLACETIEYFSLLPEGSFTNGIFSEKSVYYPETVAVLHDTVANTYSNYYPGRVTDTITVRDKAGNVHFEQSYNLGNMFASSRSITARWNIGRVLPGEYIANAIVREDGVIVAQSECTLEITATGGYAFAGMLDIPQKTVKTGEDVFIQYDIENIGDAEADSAYAIISVLNPGTLETVYQRRTLYHLPIGTNHVGALNVPSELLHEGDYIVIYNVEADGVLHPMQSNGFFVVGRNYILSGKMELPQTKFKLGENVPISYEIENTGDADAENVYAVITVQRSSALQTVYQHRMQYSLSTGTKETSAFNVPSEYLDEGDYLIVYNIEANGSVYPVQIAGFTVFSEETSNVRRTSGQADIISPDVPLGKPYVIEGIDIDTGEVIYTSMDAWKAADIQHVFAPRIPGWVLAEGEADFQTFHNDSLPDTVRFKYRKDTGGIHEKYLYGYPDMTVRPDRLITRGEAAAMMYRLIRHPDKEKFEVGQNRFTDSDGHWAEIDIEYLAYVGLVTGYPDGKYCPEENMTREELIALLVRYANYIPDVVVETGSGGWSGDYVDKAVSNGYVSGFPDGTLRLEDNVTRAQTITILNRIWNRVFAEHSVSDQLLIFTDILKTHWSYANIVEASITHEYRRDNVAEIVE